MTNGAATSPSPRFGATDLGDEDVAAPRKAFPNDPYLSSGWGVAPLGIIHARFEILHPFLDGNGRVGRMLIPLFLYEKKVLGSPMFYLSSYLEAYRQEYCDRLLAITEEGDWEGWLLFFLEAMRAQADANAQQAKDILALYDRLLADLPKLTHSQFAAAALDTLFISPVFRQADFIQRSKIPKASGARIVGILLEKGYSADLAAGVWTSIFYPAIPRSTGDR